MVAKLPPGEAKRRAVQRTREWRAKNPERVRENNLRNYAEKREENLAKSKQWRADNPERVRENNRASYARNKAQQREYGLAKHARLTYGLSPEEWRAVRMSPCEICGFMPSVADHDEPGTLRGSLCDWHNRALGLFNHSPALLRRAAEYLERNAK